VKLAKVAKKSSTDVTDKKPEPPNQKIFLRANYKPCASFDALTRSVTRTRAEIFLHKATCESAVFCEPLELT